MINRFLQIICAALAVTIATAQSKESKDDTICFDCYTESNHFAEYPGGDDSLVSFLKNNLVYPNECAEQKIQGTVLLQFIILHTGKVDSIRAVRKVHPLLDQEAIRVAGLLNNWIPAVTNGTPVNVGYTLPIRFKLQSQEEISQPQE